MTRATAAIVMTAAAAWLTGCSKAESEEKPLTPVKIQPVESFSATDELRYSANVQPATQVDLAFKAGGFVEQIHQVRGAGGLRNVQEGDFVPAGTLLARVRQSDYIARLKQATSQALEARASLQVSKAQVAEAEASLARAKLDFGRADNLFSTQSVTRAEHDAARAQLDASRARADAARLQISALEARIAGAEAAISEADIALADTGIRSPIDGILLKSTVEVGTLVGAGTAAFSIADMRTVKVMFGVPDTVLASIKPGALLPIHTEALPDREFSGRVTQISPFADSKSRTFDVELTTPNRDNRLKAGMIASVTLTGSRETKQVLVAPLTAVVRSPKDSKGYAVFLVREEGGKQIARLRDVQLGETFGNRVACTSGVGLGERVITSGSQLVSDGEVVRVIP